ncbi:MAG: hypothetical protein Q9221_000156 [Calogaya cf. arnoldii]
MARWDVLNLPTNLSKSAPESPWKLQGRVLWVFLLFQVAVYPVLHLLIEPLLFGTALKQRTVDSKSDPRAPTVQLREFSKVYRQHWFSRLLWKKKPNVDAVKNLTLDAHKGQILMLLGPHGSGKSTTFDAIAGLSKVSSGRIDINGVGGLGIAPQKNMLWAELTVKEHVSILSNLKAANTKCTNQDMATSIDACDLVDKKEAKSKTLSGGQKRRLQLAMMFAGGSSVCCVDEVSSGLDPLSRRKIWVILLAERGDRTIIMTTHFLDEADFLSDHIAVLSTGHLKADSSSAALKHLYGESYSIHVPAGTSAPYVGGVRRTETLDGTTFATLDPADTARIVDALGRAAADDFRISGPNLEDVFLRLTENPLHPVASGENSNVSVTREKPKHEDSEVARPISQSVNLHSGKHISPWQQCFIAKAETYPDFIQQVQVGNATIAPGAFWLGDGSSKPTFAWPARPSQFADGLVVQNALNNLLIDGQIITSFEQFDAPESPLAYGFVALLFVIYYSLVPCLYPGFFA